MVLRLRPNADQPDTVNFVQKGHNVLINVQAGVGKSEVVKFIIRSLQAVGKNVGVFEETFENVIESSRRELKDTTNLSLPKRIKTNTEENLPWKFW